MLKFPAASGELNIILQLHPEPIHNQLWANHTYRVNVTLNNNNSNIDFSSYNRTPIALIFEQIITFTGKGTYDFGDSTTGYSYILDEYNINQTSAIETRKIKFNITLEKDSFDYGMKPYEIIEINIESNLYIKMDKNSKNLVTTSKKNTFFLVDEIQSQYLMGKYIEMKAEIFSISNLQQDSVKLDQYFKHLKNMNNSLLQKNLIEALKIWKQYDENVRMSLIKDLSNIINFQKERITNIESLEKEQELLEKELENLYYEYELLDETYIALTNTYQKVNTELNSTKKNLTTSISAIFLSAIIFYFIGQHGIVRSIE
jgi:hypothetical protein